MGSTGAPEAGGEGQRAIQSSKKLKAKSGLELGLRRSSALCFYNFEVFVFFRSFVATEGRVLDLVLEGRPRAPPSTTRWLCLPVLRMSLWGWPPFVSPSPHSLLS